MKKVLAALPLLFLSGFMAWMSQNYLGSLRLEFAEADSYVVFVDGDRHEVDGDSFELDVWAKKHNVSVWRDGYESFEIDVDVNYQLETVETIAMDLAVGLEFADPLMPYRVGGRYVKSGDYRDNLREVVFAHGVGEKFTGQSEVLNFGDDVFRVLFDPSLRFAVARAGNLLSERVTIYDLENGKKYPLSSVAVSAAWSVDGSLALLFDDPNAGLELGIWKEGEYVKLRSFEDLDRAEVSFSPQGNRLLVLSKGDLPERNLFVVNAVDGLTKKITTGGFVYGFSWFPDGEHLLIDREGAGSSLRTLWMKNLVSGMEERLDLRVPFDKVLPLKKDVVLLAERAQYESVSLGGNSFGDLIEKTVQEAQTFDEDIALPEQYYIYDLVSGERSLVVNNVDGGLDVDSMVIDSAGKGVYLISGNEVYRLIFEL